MATSKTGEEKPNGRLKADNFSVIGHQFTFKNWLAAGQNNIASNFLINYDFTYKKGDINWENKVITRRDLAKTKMLTL
ncbi:MAG: DUF3078 domain-containing protein [Flavobacterium micromati]|nr:DUF3078 domain-containing protein [Flavobacterium micromati]